MPTLTVNENQFKHICDDAKVPCQYAFVAGSFKQSPYVLIEWSHKDNHVHVELEKLKGDRYYRVTGSSSKMIYEFEMSGFHIKLREGEGVHDYMGFAYTGGGVWTATWRKTQIETVDNKGMPKFRKRKLGKEDESFLLQVGRNFITDLGTVTNTKQALDQEFKSL